MTLDDTCETAAIRTDGLTKRFDGVVAVDHLDLRVERGEVFGFLGPNGAGKSTVINLLLDFVRPTAGSATVLGFDPRSDAERIRRRTGVLPEGGSLYDRLTGREHLEWVARANGVGVDEHEYEHEGEGEGDEQEHEETAERVDPDDILERVGLSSDDGGRPVGGYSKGMARRLALGMALVGDPDLLILDEPSSGLDPRGMRTVREIVREEAENGRTVFFSSHVLGEVEAVCDRIGILNDGRLAAVGTPTELRTALNLGETITLEVEPVPEIGLESGLESELEALAGVESVTISPTDANARAASVTITATLSDPRAKVDVVTCVNERSRVLDIVSTDVSLERVFDTYTSGSSASAGGSIPAADDRGGSPFTEVES